MKKIKLLLTILGLTFTSVVSASDISYSIINSTSTTTNSFSFSVNTILKRIIYDCDLTTYDCKQTKEQINQRLEDPIKLVTLDFLNEKEKNKATTTPTTTTVSVSKKEDLVFGNQLIPKDARFLTYSSDGKKLAYFKNDSSMIKSYKNYVLVFDDGKTLEKFEASGDWDLVTDAYRMFGFTGDSKKLVYVDDRDGSNRLYLVDFESKNQNLTGTPLITKNYTVLDFIVNGDNVYFIANRDGAYNWGLYELNLTTKKLSTIGKSVMYTNSLAIVGDNLIFTENSNGSGIIKSYFFNDKKVKSFTGILEDKLDTLPYKIVNTPNIKGVLYSPQKTVSTKKAVIWLHGGPYRQTDINRHSYGSYATFDWMLDEMVRSGAYVLKLDYPGSMGYGVKYTTSIVGRIGDVDIKNVSQSIDYLKNLGIKEVYLFGNSYGGYLSAKASVDLSSKIAGAIAVAPVTDWEKLIRDVSPTPFEVHFGGIPNTKNMKLFDKSSIVKNLQKLQKPLFVFHGDLDNQVPFSQSEYLFKESQKIGKDIKYFSVKNQGHVISGVSQNEAICNKLAEMLKISTTTEFCVMN